MTDAPLRNSRSHLFYQTDHARPTLDRADGIYMWDTDGNRFIDGSSGAMVCNIGHSNPAVLAAMRAQMDRSTFGYRLHFVTEASEHLAAKLCGLAWPGMDAARFVEERASSGCRCDVLEWLAATLKTAAGVRSPSPSVAESARSSSP